MNHYAQSGDTRIYYQIRGSGEPLVLLMGFGADGNTWEKHASEYEKHFSCILIDNRGVGRSDQPPGPYTTAMMAADTLVVMEHAGIKRAHMAGISMGGAIAQEFALAYPERLISLLLISTWPRFNTYTKQVYGNLIKLRRACPSDVFMETLQLWIYAPPFYAQGLKELEAAQAAAQSNPKPQSREGFEGQLQACMTHDAVDRLHEIQLPTLITVGEMDIFTPPAYSKILHQGIKGSDYKSFPDGGHVHHWEALEEFNKVTTDFLRKRRRG